MPDLPRLFGELGHPRSYFHVDPPLDQLLVTSKQIKLNDFCKCYVYFLINGKQSTNI